MSLNITLFGQLVDITGAGALEVEPVADTSALIDYLVRRFPALEHAKYAIAVDKKIILESTPITDSSVVALLPPFSGG